MLSSLAVGVVALGVLLDPYTLRASASDDIRLAPLWQLGAGFLDIALLVAAGICIWRRATYKAVMVLGAEMIFNLLISIVHVQRHGVTRFVTGIGAEEYLSWYLGALILRAGLVMWMARELALGSPVQGRSSGLSALPVRAQSS